MEMEVPVPPGESDFRVRKASVTTAPERLGREKMPGVLAHPDSQVTPKYSFCRLQQGADDSPC